MATYRIVRYFREDNITPKTVVRGLTLEQAQAHCSRTDTKGAGWFDGYQEEV